MSGDPRGIQLVRELSRQGKRIALAESCTGGVVAATLTAVPGASRVLWGSAVVYTVAAKEAMLGLDPTLLRQAGTVSATVTEALAVALLERSSADLAAAVTGWAGPDSDGPDPVGTVYLALAEEGGCELRRLQLQGDREGVRRRAAGELIAWALEHVRRLDGGGDDG